MQEQPRRCGRGPHELLKSLLDGPACEAPRLRSLLAGCSVSRLRCRRCGYERLAGDFPNAPVMFTSLEVPVERHGRSLTSVQECVNEYFAAESVHVDLQCGCLENRDVERQEMLSMHPQGLQIYLARGRTHNVEASLELHVQGHTSTLCSLVVYPGDGHTGHY